MLVIPIEPEDYSHYNPCSNIQEAIIDLSNTTTEDRLELLKVLKHNQQLVSMEHTYTNIWDNWNQYITGYCCSYTGEWNITGIVANISLIEFNNIYKIKDYIQ